MDENERYLIPSGLFNVPKHDDFFTFCLSIQSMVYSVSAKPQGFLITFKARHQFYSVAKSEGLPKKKETKSAVFEK